MAKAEAVYRASVRGARRSGHSLDRAGRRLQGFLLDEWAGNLAPKGTRAFREFAPHRSGALARGMQANVRSRGGWISVEFVSTARSEEGFDYFPVTRFGRGPVFPHPPRRFLRFRDRSGQVRFARSVKAWKPARDWVQQPVGVMEREFTAAERRIGRRIETSLIG